MSLIVPTHDARDLAAFLAEHRMPGQRSMTAIERLRRQRRATPAPGPLTLTDRLHERITAQAVAEIERRGGETVIEGKGGRVNASLYLAARDARTRTALLKAEGWRYYPDRPRRASLAYLYGTDDAGPWAVRVPGTVASLHEALWWVEPAEVSTAISAKRRVRRQGDVYAIETTGAHDGKGAEQLPESHEWRPATRYLVHRPEDGRRHRPLRLTYPVRFVRQRVLAMGRSGGRAYGD